MNGDIDDILDESLRQLKSGEATLDECLANYPDEAAILRPLLEIALGVQGLERPEVSPVGFGAGKQLMLVALAEKRRRQTASPSPWSRSAEQMTSLLGRGKGPSVRWRKPVLISGLAVAAVFVWVLASSLLLQTWRSGAVGQRAELTDAAGVVQMQARPGGAWQQVSGGELVEAGAVIITGKSSGVTLTFFDGSTTSLGGETEITVSQLSRQRDGGGSIIAIHQGVGQTSSRVEGLPDSASLFQIETATAVARVQGTEFRVDVASDGTTRVVVIEGVVQVTAQEATVPISSGQATTVQSGEAPGQAVSVPVAEPSHTPEVAETREPTESPVPAETEEATATSVPGETPGLTYTPTSTSVTSPTPTCTPTSMPVPPMPTDTPVGPVPTDTPVPTSTPTNTPTPTPAEVVEIFLARYRENQEELMVKAMTNRPQCSLTLVGFGPMEPEGGHWVYVETNLAGDDAPSTVTVTSSCGGSDTSPVE